MDLGDLSAEPAVAAGAQACSSRGVNLLAPMCTAPPVLQLGAAVTTVIDDDLRPLYERRFVNYVARTLRSATTWVASARSDEATWTRLRSEVEGFLATLWRNGILLGGTPEQAFFVRCGRDTMTDQDIAEGRVVVTLGFALARPELKLPDALVVQAFAPDDPLVPGSSPVAAPAAGARFLFVDPTLRPSSRMRHPSTSSRLRQRSGPRRIRTPSCPPIADFEVRFQAPGGAGLRDAGHCAGS